MYEPQSLLTINDFIGVPLVLAFFILLIKWLAPIYIKEPKLLQLFYWGLLLRVAGIVLSLLFYTYVEGYGDTFYYFRYAQKISMTFSNSSFDDIQKIFFIDYADLPIHIKSTLPDDVVFKGLFTTNKFIILATAVVSFFTFDSYVSISIVFTLFGYFGIWLIFYRLTKLYPELYKYFFLFLICWPSSFFWGSGVMKEPLCMGCIGILFYLSFGLKAHVGSILKNMIIAIPFCLMLLTVKAYLLAGLGISLLFALLFYLINTIHQPTAKRIAYLIVSFMLIAPLIYFFIYGADLITTSVSQYLLESVLTTTKAQLELGNSNYDLGEIELSPFGILKYLLSALNVALFGPFFFQINKLQLLISGGESFLMLLLFIFVLYKIKFIRILKSMKNDPVLIFSFFFILIVGVQIGAIAFNYGTLVRYKMPLVPFFFTFFFILLYHNKVRSVKIMDT